MTHPLDYLSRRVSQARALLGFRPWLDELAAYKGDSVEDVEMEYDYKRKVAAALWAMRPRLKEEDYRHFYEETDYWVYRQAFHHRHESWHWILRWMNELGDMCEYGAGIAPVTAWIAPRRPGWSMTVVEPPTAMLKYAQWRLRWRGTVFLSPGLGADLPLFQMYDVITCLDVLEHTINPLQIVAHLEEHLRSGGHLFINFVRTESGQENLREAQGQREDVIRFLRLTLTARVPLETNRDVQRAHYVKP